MDRVLKQMAITLMVIFICTTFVHANPSLEWAPEDYRYTDKIYDIHGNRTLRKPTAMFTALRWRDGIGLLDSVDSYSGMDVYAPYPILKCYVGDTLSFLDKSYANNGSDRIVEWDWQQYGALGDRWGCYNSNVLSESGIELTQPGTTTFFLCVRSNYPVGKGSVDLWSDNGNHQIVGQNKFFKDGMYWYFASVQVVVLPTVAGNVQVRYVDTSTNQPFSDTTLYLGELSDETPQLLTEIIIPEQDGYQFRDWQITLPDGTKETQGTDKNTAVNVSGEQPLKILTAYFVPNPGTVYHPPGANENDNNPGGNNGGDGSDSDTAPPSERPPAVSGKCDGVITWEETDSHEIITGYTKNKKPIRKTCYHTYSYEAVLTANAAVNPEVFKSGYGFELPVDCTTKTNLKGVTATSGKCSWNKSRKPAKQLLPPSVARVDLPFTVTNRRGTQPSTIYLDISAKGQNSVKFQAPANPISEISARKIYTDVALAGTKEQPVTHNIDIYITGGGIGNVEWCLHIPKSFVINGDLYEDDFSAAD